MTALENLVEKMCIHRALSLYPKLFPHFYNNEDNQPSASNKENEYNKQLTGR